MTRPGRIPCCVPFCRRTAAQDRLPSATEIICGKHWRASSERKRRVYRRACRAWRVASARQIGPGAYGNKADFLAAHRAGSRCDRLWSAMKREIIEIAVGIRRAG